MKNRIKYLYVLGSCSRVTFEFIKLTQSRYRKEEHFFYIPMGKKVLSVEPEFGLESNVIFPPNERMMSRLLFEYRLFSNAENIILHGIFFQNSTLIPLLINKYSSNSISWIEHGGDLYNWKDNRNTISSKLINWLNKKVREKSKVIGICHPMDEYYLRKEFDINCPVVYTQFRTIEDPFSFFEKNKPKTEKDKKLVIQVGHNAFEIGKHIQVLDMLEKYKDENIRIVLPMSYGLSGIKGKYGGVDYRNAVFRVAKCIFKNKAIPMYRKIDLNSYIRYLWNVDIVILNLTRQAGLGNIHPLLYMNKKIFMPSDSPMYQFFIREGVEVYNTYDIDKMTYEEFKKPISNDNRDWVVNFLTKFSYETWDNFFKNIDERGV